MNLRFAVISLVLALLTSGCSQEPETALVVLVSVDGLSASYLENPRAPLPTLRRLAREGASAKGMVTSFPSVTWTAHTSLITGATPAKHGILGNSVIDRDTGEQVRYIGDRNFTKDECVRTPTLYDAVHNSGMTTASILWPATKAANSIDWNLPEPPEDLDRIMTPGLADELEQAGISVRSLIDWGWGHEYAPMRDALYTRIAVHLLDRHQPNLTLVHLVTPDALEHDHGPDVEEAYWSVGDSDGRIREIWEALQQPPLASRSNLFIVSDHGFAPVERQIRPNVLLRQSGLITLDREGKPAERKAWVHASGGSAGLYIFDRENTGRIIADLKSRLASLEGLDSVLTPDEFASFGLPSPGQNSQQADLMLSAKPGYGFDSQPNGDDVLVATESRTGAHGHRPDRGFMHATFVAAGAHIRPGIKLNEISSTDIAPTIAAILGVKLPEADGKVLTEILK